MSKKSNANALNNAEEIIERFGGIRPMAKKIDVAVTTIQGWKKRNTIPAARRPQIIAAAAQHDIDLSGIVDAAPGAGAQAGAPEQIQVEQAQAAQTQAEQAPSRQVEAPEAQPEVGDDSAVDEKPDAKHGQAEESAAVDVVDAIELSAIVDDGESAAGGEDDSKAEVEDKSAARETISGAASVPVSKPALNSEGASTSALEPSSPETSLSPGSRPKSGAMSKAAAHDESRGESEADLAAKLALAEKKAATSTWINIVSLLAVLVMGVAAFLLWPSAKDTSKQLLRDEVAQAPIIPETAGAEDKKSLFETLVPKDLPQRIGKLKDQAVQAKNSAGTAINKVKEVSSDVLAEDAGTFEERAGKLQLHASEIIGEERLQSWRERLPAMNSSLLGQQKLSQSVSEISTLVSGLGGNLEGLNGALDSARQQSANLNQTLDGVPTQDLKAAALLMSMTQFRSSLNRDNQPFEEDLQLLMKLVGEDNAELSTALSRLAPQAQSGVLTPSGLSREFKTIAGDVVVSSLKGEDVSFKDRAQARFSEVLQIEKDGELINGTPTQAAMVKANRLLEEGDIAGAVSQVRALEPEQAAIAQPWVEEAQVTLLVEELKKLMAGEGLSFDGLSNRTGPKLVIDRKNGINLLTPGTNRLDNKKIFE